jgi:hypothetical protein
MWVHWCGDSRAAEPCGQCRRLAALEPHGGGVADVGRAGSKVEVAHRDSVWNNATTLALSYKLSRTGRSRSNYPPS